MATYGQLPKCWPIPCVTWGKETVIDWEKFVKELLQHKDEEKSITEEQKAEAIINLRAYFIVTYGKKRFEKAVNDEKAREEVYNWMNERKIKIKD